MKDQARVVVIGGGVIGCSILYYLTKLGWTDVVLVEKAELTAGTTWHAAGNVHLAEDSPALNRINLLSWKLYRALEAETGESVGWHHTGSIRIAKTRKTLDRYAEIAKSVRHVGIEYEMIGLDDIKRLHPLVELDGILGAAFVRDDGVLDPSMTTHAFARLARGRGAEIYRQTRVTALDQKPSGDWQVVTDKGAIRAEVVVIAAGFWSPVVAAMAGVQVPIVPTERQYLVTEAIPAVAALEFELPMFRDFEVPFYFRQEQKGMLIGVHEAHTPYCFVDGIPDDFAQELFPVDLVRGEHSLKAALARMPLLGQVGIKSEICGPTSRTPDLSGLMGPVPDRRNLHIVAGYTAGISHGAAIGLMAAEWIVDGEPGIDASPLDIGRFGGYATKRYIRSMLGEAHVFGTIDRSAERQAGRPARASPLYHRLKQRGAVYGARMGWECPMWFAGRANETAAPGDADAALAAAIGECGAVRAGAGVMDITATAKYEVSGPGADAYLDRLCANRLPPLGGIARSPMLNERGRMSGFVTLARIGAQRFYLTAPALAELRLLAWMQRHLPANGTVRVENVTARDGALLLAGPKAREVLGRISDAKLANGAFPWNTVREIDAGYAPTLALRFNAIGELGWELYHGMEFHAGIYDALVDAGADHAIADFGLRAYDTMRLEKAVPAWGADFTADQTPLAVGLGGFVAWDKEEFIGRDALVAERRKAAPPTLAYVAVDVEKLCADVGRLAFDGDRSIGIVRSSAYSAALKKALAFVAMEHGFGQPGSSVAFEIFGKLARGQVLSGAVFDPDDVRAAA
ncbi:MAG: GcvT family protein [Alphaproteobacteria bacterium]|nr:GcvT family protein [Alphaproteobacteria bacterium]